MSTVSPPESRPTALPPTRDPLVVARPAPTPFFTRHMLGATEADRDRRRTFHATHRRLPPGRTAIAHPKIAAALAAEARSMTQARMDYSRWADEGGRFDPEAAARIRIGDREMKRCNS